MGDLTILFLTVNKVPKDWAKYHATVLLEATGDAPIMTISKEPMDWGTNLLQTGEITSSNIYRQMLRAAKIAKTPFVAVAEDDTLYSKAHFKFRPPLDTFAYDMNRWSLFTWGVPTYSLKQRISNCGLIAPRELLIEALEERFAKYPDGTPLKLTGEVAKARIDRQLGLTLHKSVEYRPVISIIQFNHDYGIGVYQRSHKKRMGMIRAFDIPFWGKADKLVAYFK